MKDLHILVKDIPPETNRILRLIAAARGLRKWEVIRTALIEYAEHHAKDVASLVRIAKR